MKAAIKEKNSKIVGVITYMVKNLRKGKANYKEKENGEQRKNMDIISEIRIPIKE